MKLSIWCLDRDVTPMFQVFGIVRYSETSQGRNVNQANYKPFLYKGYYLKDMLGQCGTKFVEENNKYLIPFKVFP